MRLRDVLGLLFTAVVIMKFRNNSSRDVSSIRSDPLPLANSSQRFTYALQSILLPAQLIKRSKACGPKA
jgi:hypothetical protein